MTMEATKLAVLLLRLNSALRVHTALALFAALGLVPQPAAAVDNLPTGYEPLLYIDSDDTAHTWKTQGGTTAGPYIVLTNPDGSAFVPEATDTIELKYAFDAVIGASEKSSCWLFCSRQGGNGKFGFLRTSDQGSGFRYDYADKSMSISSPANYNNTSVRTVTANSDGIYFDGSLTPAVQVSGAASYIKAKVPMYLFAAHPEETADATTTSVQFEAKYGTAKMYYFRVKKSDGEYRMNLVPAKDSDGKVGMYDLVSDQFFTSASEVAFSGSEYGKWYMKGEDAVNTSSFAKSSSATIGWASTLNGTVDKDHTVSSVNDYFVPSEAVLRTSNDDATENKFNGHSLTIDGGGFSLKSQSGDITSGATAPNHYKTITVANLVLKNNGKIAHATDGVEYTLAGGTVEIPAGETGVFSVSGKNVRHLKVQSKLVGGGILNIEWSGNDTGPATNNHKIEFDGDCSEFTGTITAEEALADDNRILTLVFDKPFGGTITSLPKAKTNAIKVNYDENNQGLTVDDAATVIPAALREDLVFYGTTTDFTNTENLPLVTFPKTAVSPASASDLHDAVRDGTYSVTIKYAASDDGTATQFSQGNMGVIDNFDDTYTLVASYAQTSIAGATVTYSLASATYNGSKQEPTVTVTLDSVDITDFCDVSWGSQGLKDAGSYTPTITAKAGSRYTGSVTPQNKFTIAPKTVTLSWSNVNLTYNGQPQHPTCTAGDLVSGDTCNVTLTAESSKTNAGNDYMAEAKSLDNSNYQLPTADKQKGYSITQKSLSGNVKFSSIAAQTYSGSAITPTFIVTDNARSAQLTKDTDYTVEYSDNFNAGTATITITGMGNYKDTATTTFTINAKSLTSSMVTLSKTEAKKDGQGWNVLSTVTVKDGVTTLTENTHYTKTWSPSEVTGAGVYTCTVTGNGNYSGTATKTYTVTAPEDPDAVPLPRLVRSRFVYDGTPKTVAFVSTVGFTPSGTTSGTDVGEYEITCTLDSDKHWEDGSTDLIVVKWWIVEKDNRPFLERLADDPRKVDTSPYATGGDIILQEGNEYIHVFTNTVTAGTFSLTADKKARVLTVGGGGSGGSTYEGQSGGGGAGGVKYDPAYPLSADRTYEIHVGKAGVWTTYDVDPNSPGYSNVQEYQKAFPTGVNGGESYLICDGQNHILPAGGGGYGQQFYWGSITVNSGSSVGNGVNGGAGGGCGYGGFISGGTGGHRGSNKTGTNIMSGSQSGGGGGAARDGTDLNESTGAIWGQGGDGINCDILGFHQVFGGGGAGFSSISDVPGGIGGGGSWDGELRMPILAENGLGGGGPGGNRDSGVQLNGGSGLVVIRYSAASTPIVKTILVPEAIEGLAYTGWAQTGVPDGFGYTLSGKSRETNAGDYVAIATLAEGYVWSDGTKDPIEIHWSIAPADLGSARGVLIGAPAQMAMGAIVKPTFKFMFNGKEVPAAKYQITDWSGELMNLGTYTAIATPTAAGTNLTGAREVTFTINNSVATYYHVGENGGGYSSFETSQDAGIGWSTELGGVVDANHKVFANCDYVLPTGTTLRTVEKDANQTFNGNSLELRGGTLALKRIGSSNGVWYAPNQIYTFNRLIANGGGISAYTDAHLEVDAAELIFAEGGLAILVSGSNSRQITLKTTVRNYTKGDLVINPNGGGTGANQAKGVTLLGDWSEFTGDIITKTMDTKCQDFHLCVPVAFNGRVRSLPPPAMINSNKEQDRYTAVIFDYDKFRDQTRGLLIGTNDVNAVALLKNRLYLITTKSSKTPNLPVMTFPAGTEVTASEFTGVRVISSYTANTQPATGTVLTGMGTRMNEDGTITLYANFSNDIAKFDVTCPPQVYTGSELTPVVTVKLAGRTLVEGTDYTIGTWSGGLTAVGDHLATITGLGDYEDTTNVTFTILSATAIDLSQNYTFDPVDVPYDGKPHTVAVELTDAAKGATVKYSETEDGPYTLDQAPSPVLPYNATIYCEISREGSTTVYRSAQLTIRAWVNAWNEASNVAPKITPTSWAAGGSAGTVTDATAKYGVVKSYLQLHGTSVSNLWSRAMPDVPGNYVIYYIPEELPYVTNENMGVRKIEFTITGGLSGSITAPSQTYTGSPLTPAYTVTYTVPSKGVSRTLIKDIDFTEGSWSPAGLTDADDYQMTLSGIPPYTGSITVNFKINQAQNEWTQLPAISPTEWTTTESYGALTPGKTKFGSVTATYTQNGVEMGPFPGLAALAAAKKKGEFVVTYTAPTTDANVLQPTELTQSVTFTITQGEYTYGKYETLSAAGGAYTVVTNAAFGADDEIDNMPVEVTAYANRDADLLMFHDGTAPVAATFNHFRIIGTDGQLQHNLVPARRDDGTDGFYDTVSKQFFANSNEVQGATLTVENNVTAEVAVPELAATTIRETGAEIDILARNGVSAQGMLVHGTAKATGPGTYTFTLTPDDAHVWAGGTFATRTYAWTITEDTRTEVKKPYAITPAPQWNGGSTVNGVGYDSTLLNELYSIGGDGISKSEVGEYVSTAKLLNPEQDRWEGTHESELTINWSIVQAVNEWTTELELSKRGWEPGEAVSLTTPVAKFGTVQGWLKRPGSAAFEAWTPDIRSLSVNGDYQLKFTVEGTTQYSSLEVIQDFRIKDGTMKDDIVAENVEAVYDGQPHGITVMCEGSATNATVRFMDSSGGYTLTESPTQTDVGVLTVWYQVSKTGKVTVTDSRTVTVIKRTPVVSGTAALAGWTEGDEGEHIPSGCAVTPAECGPVVYGYYADAACTRRFAGQPVAAGTYYVRGEVAEGETWFAAVSMPATAFTITSADPDGVPLPKVSPATYEHTGSTITPVFEATAGYTTDGDTSATAVGTYTITCTLEEGKHWVGGSTAPYDLQWEIVAKEAFLQKLARDPRRVNGALETDYDTGYAVGGDLVLFDSETSEYIHVFTNTSEIANFTPSQNLNARVLLVGGGGGGGGDNGGGGGAGGMVEDPGLLLLGGADVAIVVGKGAAGVNGGVHGGDGTYSQIAVPGVEPVVAYGGGGGGATQWANVSGDAIDHAKIDGHGGDGFGSGGGASGHYKDLNQQAGSGNPGRSTTAYKGVNQGCDGGASNDKRSCPAGGGGGAGAPGSTSDSADGAGNIGGIGGDGRVSDILGAEFINQYFAGGGGGGGGEGSANRVALGGKGGGGNGADTDYSSSQTEATVAQSGENGLGGGGGGGKGGTVKNIELKKGAAGGDGIVIIRYAAPNAREVAPVPESWKTVRKLFANGKTQVGVESASRGSTLSGDYYGDVAGTYTAIATLAPGYTSWEDGETASSRPITWQMLDYTRLEYLDNGTDLAKAGYVVLTNFHLTGANVVELKYNINVRQNDKYQNVFMTRQSGKDYGLVINPPNGHDVAAVSYGSDDVKNNINLPAAIETGRDNVIRLCPTSGTSNGLIGYLNGADIQWEIQGYTYVFFGDEFPHDLLLFTAERSTNLDGKPTVDEYGKLTSAALAKMYYFRVENSAADPTLRIDLVPVIDNATGVRGFYDLVSGNFYPLQTPVVLDGNGGTPSPQYVYVSNGEPMPALPGEPTLNGYDFKGYFSAATGGTQYYDARGKAVTECDFGENTSLYAQWEAVKYHVINPETGPEIAVDRTWLEGAFEGGKTKEQYQQDLFTTNASGVVAWQAYVLGFGAANWSSAALVEETVQNADPATVTIQLKDLPSERPEDTGCTVTYSLYASPSTDVLLAGGGSVVTNKVDKDAVKEYYKWHESTFEAPLSDLDDDNPVRYYRIKVHFTFGGGGGGGEGSGDYEEVMCSVTGTIKVGGTLPNGWSDEPYYGDYAILSATYPIPDEIGDDGYVRVSFRIKAKWDASYLQVFFRDADGNSISYADVNANVCDGFGDTKGEYVNFNAVYRLPKGSVAESIQFRWWDSNAVRRDRGGVTPGPQVHSNDDMIIEDLTITGLGALKAADACDSIRDESIVSSAWTDAMGAYFDPSKEEWKRNLSGLTKALNQGGEYNVLIIGDSLSFDPVDGCIEALIKRQWPMSNVKFYSAWYNNTGCYQIKNNDYKFKDQWGNVVRDLRDLDFTKYQCVIFAGITQARFSPNESDASRGANAVAAVSDVRDWIAAKAPDCQFVILSPLLSHDSRKNYSYAEDHGPNGFYDIQFYATDEKGYIYLAGTNCNVVTDWDVSKDPWAVRDYYPTQTASPSMADMCQTKGMAYWDLYKVAYDYLFRCGKPLYYYSRDAVHTNSFGKQLAARLVFEAFKIVGGASE